MPLPHFEKSSTGVVDEELDDEGFALVEELVLVGELEVEVVAEDDSELGVEVPPALPVEDWLVVGGASTEGASCDATVVEGPGSTGLAQTPPEAVETPFA